MFAMATGRGVHAICEECEELACSFGVGASEPVMETHGEGEVDPIVEIGIDLARSAMLAPQVGVDTLRKGIKEGRCMMDRVFVPSGADPCIGVSGLPTESEEEADE